MVGNRVNERKAESQKPANRVHRGGGYVVEETVAEVTLTRSAWARQKGSYCVANGTLWRYGGIIPAANILPGAEL